MVVNCSKQTLEDLIQNLKENKIKKFSIEERKADEHRGEYNIEFELVDEPRNVDLEFRLHNADIIKEFLTMLLAGRVTKFFMHYDVEGLKSIVSKAYRNEGVALSANSAGDILADDLVSILNKAMSVAMTDGVDGNLVPELTRKIKREGGKPQFKEVKVADAIQAIINVVKD